MKYIVISHYSLGDLITDVEEHIAEGWEPQGGVATAYWQDKWDTQQFRFLQAMVHHGMGIAFAVNEEEGGR